MAKDATRKIQRLFLSSPAFAVVGASKDQNKYGTKVLKWYKERDYKVTPVHPKEAELEGITTVASIADLPSPKETSVSIITPPKVTLSILEQAKDSVRAFWLQPGAEDSAVMEYIKTQGLSDHVIFGGPCILVEGDGIKKSMLGHLGARSIRLNVLWLSVISVCNLGRVLAGPTTSAFVSAAWYTGWHATDFPLSNVSWTKYSHMKYALATTSPSPNLLTLDPSDENELPKFVAQAHQYGVKASLTIGGWTGSRWFSSNVGSPQNRTMFVTSVSNLISTYELDGIDFDWEFPGSAGIGCNVFSPNDTDNYLAFLQEFRQDPIGSNVIVSLAVYVQPYPNSSGGTSNMTAFSQVVDYVEIMDYDIQSSPSAGAGPSSPLNDTCAPPASQLGSAVSAVKAWTDAGMPLDKIVLGVPAYGHSFAVSRSDAINNTSGALVLDPQYDPTRYRKGDQWDNGWGVDVCGNKQGPGGTFTYRGLINNNILNDNGTTYEGIAYAYDNCSQTPFAYDPQTQTLISYEDPMSFAVKGRYISASGLKGFAMWEAGGDYHDALLDAMLSGLQDTSSGTSAGNPKAISRDVRVTMSTSVLLGFVWPIYAVIYMSKIFI